MKVLVLTNEGAYDRPWQALKPDVTLTHTNTHQGARQGYPDPAHFDAIQFTGGSDVSPELYLEANTASGNDYARDLVEMGIYLRAREIGIPMFGICRGSQFLRVAEGGKLVQDFQGHAIGGTHPSFLSTDIGRGHISGPAMFETTSTHHQHAVPDPSGELFYDILTADKGTVVEGWISDNCMAVQYHPEYMEVETDGFQFYLDLLRYGLRDVGIRRAPERFHFHL